MEQKKEFHFVNIETRLYWVSWMVLFPCYFLMLKQAILMIFTGLFHLEQTDSLIMLSSSLIRNVVTLLLVFVLFQNFWIASWKDFRAATWKQDLYWFGKGLLYYIIAQFVNALINVALVFIIHERQVLVNTENQSMVDSFFTTMPVLTVIYAVVIAPVVEEFIFRVIVFGTLRRFHVIVAVAGSAFLFGTVHVLYEMLAGEYRSALVGLIGYVCAGVALAILYEKRKNILFCIAVHMFFNMVSLII